MDSRLVIFDMGYTSEDREWGKGTQGSEVNIVRIRDVVRTDRNLVL